MCHMVTVNVRYFDRNFALRGASLLLVFVAGILLSQTALAQPAPGAVADPPGGKKAAEATPATPPVDKKYDEDASDESLKKNGSRVQQILGTGKFEGGQDVFDQFYNKYLLARWSVAKNAAELPKMRRELHNHLAKAKSGEVHDHLNTLVLEYMNKVATGNYYPVVQLNAMLMIGDLNKDETAVGGAAKPLPAALDVMVADVQNAKVSDAVRAAAMIGILRHVATGISDEDVKKPLSIALLKLVADVDPSAGAAAPGREWICAQAIEALAYLGSVGQNNAVFNALLKTVADNKLSISTRSIAVRSLGRLNYSGAAGISAADAATAIGQFLIDACNDVPRRAAPTGKPLAVRSWIRRPLSDALTALTGADDGTGKTGIKSVTRDDSQRAPLDKLQKPIETLTTFLDDPKREKDDLQPQVDELRKALEAWLKEKPQSK
jgi:hypothetical protein